MGRTYHLFDYVGAPDADRVIVMMGSGAETAHETVEYLNQTWRKSWACSKSGCIGHSQSSDSSRRFPQRSRTIAVLDRTKEAGAAREPLYLDVVNGDSRRHQAGLWNAEGRAGNRIGGRYGLSSKEFTPAMVKAVYDNLAKPSAQK